MAHDHEKTTHVVEHEHHSHSKLYVGIFFLLFIITAIEIAIPILNAPEVAITAFSKPLEVAILLVLMTIKGAAVMMIFMHLKGDRRMFGSLFVFPIVFVLAMAIGFLLLFQPVLW